MREIKFRLYSTEEEEMFFNENIVNIDLVCNFARIENERFKGFFDFGEGEESILMQYTGLKDKNGKEIYEGDIVKYKVKGSDKTYTTVMKFNEDHGAFLFGIYEGVKMPCGKKTRMNKYTRKSVGSVEVIGNIYENPGLLEGN